MLKVQHLLRFLPFIYSSTHRRHLHSFPTRRSSDLLDRLVRAEICAFGQKHIDSGGRISHDPVYQHGFAAVAAEVAGVENSLDRKSTRLNSSHSQRSYAVICLKKKNPEKPPAKPPKL